jgi:dihydrodipicolinate synthase/N-acetylneuraminate lyase
MKTRICGAFAPVPTPVDRAGGFDVNALTAHLEWLAQGGLDGALILGTNGEFPSFSLAERKRVAEVAASSGSGLRLLLGVGSCSVEESKELATLAGSLGYEAVLCPPPFYFRAAPVGGIADFFGQVLDASEVPVLLYHIPQVTGVAIGDDLLDRLGDHERLAGVKDSSGSVDELDRLIGFFALGSYLVGSDRLVTRCLSSGGSGSISAAANVAPRLVQAVSRKPARQPELDAVRALLEEYGLGAAAKAVLRHLGLGDYGSRPPMVGLSDKVADELVERLSPLIGDELRG